jgi:hypothetical protein
MPDCSFIQNSSLTRNGSILPFSPFAIEDNNYHWKKLHFVQRVLYPQADKKSHPSSIEVFFDHGTNVRFSQSDCNLI